MEINGFGCSGIYWTNDKYSENIIFIFCLPSFVILKNYLKSVLTFGSSLKIDVVEWDRCAAPIVFSSVIPLLVKQTKNALNGASLASSTLSATFMLITRQNTKQIRLIKFKWNLTNLIDLFFEISRWECRWN